MNNSCPPPLYPIKGEEVNLAPSPQAGEGVNRNKLTLVGFSIRLNSKIYINH